MTNIEKNVNYFFNSKAYKIKAAQSAAFI